MFVSAWNNKLPKDPAPAKPYRRNSVTLARERLDLMEIKRLESEDYDRRQLEKLLAS